MKKIIFLAALLFGSYIFTAAVFADSLYFTSTPVFTARVSEKYSYSLTTVDISKNTVSYSLKNSPSWMTINGNIVSGVPTQSGRVSVSISASDNSGNTAVQSYYINITSPEVTSTPAPEPTIEPVPSVSSTPLSTTIILTPTTSPQGNNVSLVSTLPKNGASTTSTSVLIQATINSSFALDKQNVQLFFDSKDYTPSISILTKSNADGSFESSISYLVNNLGVAKHNARIIVITPDSKTVPFSWDFSVVKEQASQLQSLQNAITSAFSHAWVGILALIVLLILIFIILVRVLRRGKKLSEERENEKK